MPQKSLVQAEMHEAEVGLTSLGFTPQESPDFSPGSRHSPCGIDFEELGRIQKLLCELEKLGQLPKSSFNLVLPRCAERVFVLSEGTPN